MSRVQKQQNLPQKQKLPKDNKLIRVINSKRSIYYISDNNHYYFWRVNKLWKTTRLKIV